MRQFSRSPHYRGSRSGSRAGRKTEQRLKHKKRSRSISPLDVRPTKKEKVVKHSSRVSKGERTQSRRKDPSKSPQRERKRARVEKVKSTKVVTKVRKFREKKEEKVVTPPRVDESHREARVNEQVADAGESDLAAESQSPESDHGLSSKLSKDAAHSQLSERYEEESTVSVQHHSAAETESNTRDVIKPQSTVGTSSDRHMMKTVKRKSVDISARARAGMLKAAVLGAVADVKQHKTKPQAKPTVKALKRKETEQKQRYVSGDKHVPKTADQPEPVLIVGNEEKRTSTPTAEVKAETVTPPRSKKKVVIKRQNVLLQEAKTSPTEEKKIPHKEDAAIDTQEPVQELQLEDGTSLAKHETAPTAVDTRKENTEEAAVFEEKSDMLDADVDTVAVPETEPSVEVGESESHEVRHKSKMKKKKHHKHHKHHRRHSKSKSRDVTEGSREETGESDNHIEGSEARD